MDSLRARSVHAQSGRSSREHPPALRWTNPFRIRRQFYEAIPGVSTKLLGRFAKNLVGKVLKAWFEKPSKLLFLIQVRGPWCNGRVFALQASPPPGRRRGQRPTGRWPRGRWSDAPRSRQTARYGCPTMSPGPDAGDADFTLRGAPPGRPGRSGYRRCGSRPRALAALSASASAVPEGASTLCLWCASTISMSKSRGSACAAMRTSSLRHRDAQRGVRRDQHRDVARRAGDARFELGAVTGGADDDGHARGAARH